MYLFPDCLQSIAFYMAFFCPFHLRSFVLGLKWTMAYSFYISIGSS